MIMCAPVCVSVCEKERDREREMGLGGSGMVLTSLGLPASHRGIKQRPFSCNLKR